MLFAIIFGSWAKIDSFTQGAKSGAVLGLFIGAAYDLINLGTSNIHSTTSVIADIGLMIVLSAITGGVVAWFLGRGNSN